jgi:hypothetical protein
VLRIRTLVIAAIAACACQALATDVPLFPRKIASLFGAPTRQSFEAKHPGTYTADEARARKLLAGAGRLRHCMTHREIKKLVGKPDYGHMTRPQGDPSNMFAGVVWYYWLYKPPGAGNSDSERGVLLFLDDSGSVYTTSTPGVADVGQLYGSKVSCKT